MFQRWQIMFSSNLVVMVNAMFFRFFAHTPIKMVSHSLYNVQMREKKEGSYVCVWWSLELRQMSPARDNVYDLSLLLLSAIAKRVYKRKERKLEKYIKSQPTRMHTLSGWNKRKQVKIDSGIGLFLLFFFWVRVVIGYKMTTATTKAAQKTKKEKKQSQFHWHIQQFKSFHLFHFFLPPRIVCRCLFVRLLC